MENQSIPSGVSPETATQVSSLKGLIEVFHQPAAWFERLRNDPKVLVPYLALFVIYLISAWVMKDVMTETIMNSPQVQEQLQSGEIPAGAEQYLWISGVASMLFLFMMAPLVGAALAMFWGNIVFAGKASFKSLLSVMLYGELIFAFGSLVVLPLILAKDSLTVGFNLGVLVVDRGLQDALYITLSKIDLFIIWEIVVIGVGLSVINRIPRNKGLLLSVLSMGLLTIIGIAAAAIGSMLR
ncbi:MAG: YIP1 family protein [candidate division Zixibacteria bacterium]|nr:YIP1 family protein [candidate division Zixibacteria bacterium]MDH3938862.1 YIP1 family protein [candidate division Zixibacteria bacterium]MDH4035832.1 YIP1 family protein [candidate division Zixibacteria bacterium]